ncbi:SDR family oxidoreductase [Chitinophaga sp. HK235]|uniref:SDR family oxidoreductase n=1 Tax=Chitinophaga sp. HK235 TaxID=2952571 RepID=UPI001BADA403|nr:SDR family oxidoreductase [Chitinophaga sp. HK235]
MENKQYITVFGATGRVGGAVLRLLSQAQIPVIAVTRNLNKTTEIPGVQWMAAEMTTRETLYRAMENSSTVFLASATDEQMVQAQCNVIEVAREQGVQHIVKLSSAMADPNASLFIARAHGQIEEKLRSSGLAGTLLRPNGFMQNWLLGVAHTVKAQRKIFEPTGDGKRTYIDMLDIAEAACKILMQPSQHMGQAYLLSGGEAISYHELAALLSTVLQEDVVYVPVSEEAARQKMEQRGLPSWAIETFLAYAAEQRQHQAGWISPDLPALLGKPARTVVSFVSAHKHAFQ